MEKDSSPTTDTDQTDLPDKIYKPVDEFVNDPSPAEQPKKKKKWLNRLNPFRGETPRVPLEDAGPVPELHAHFWSKLTWGWLSQLMLVISSGFFALRSKVGYRRPLQKEDLYQYDEARQTKVLTDKLIANIQKRQKGKSKHVLFWALNDTFFWQFWTGGLLKVHSHPS